MAQRHQVSSEQWPRWSWLQLLVISILSSGADAFHIHMEYKPPVQSSVRKLQDRRFSSASSGPTRGSGSSKSAHAAAFPQTSAPVPSFERRMRDLVLKSPRSRPVGQGLPSNVRVVETLADFKAVVGDEKEQIVAVRFHATYCRACKAVAPLYYQTAKKFPNVVFVDVPVTQKNAALHQGLGVPSLPFAHIYHPNGGLVEELKLTRNYISKFRRILDHHVKGYCELTEGWDRLSSPSSDDEEA